MESAEQPANNLHARVGESLERLGHRSSTVPPHEQSTGVIGDLTKSAKIALDEAVSGVGRQSRDRSTHSINPIRIALEKAKKLWK